MDCEECSLTYGYGAKLGDEYGVPPLYVPDSSGASLITNVWLTYESSISVFPLDMLREISIPFAPLGLPNKPQSLGCYHVLFE